MVININADNLELEESDDSGSKIVNIKADGDNKEITEEEEFIPDYEDYEVLGKVSLGANENYLSCRELCREAYPNFDFYHKFINYQSCECARMVSEKPIKIRDHDAYTFGYADDCICRYLAR